MPAYGGNVMLPCVNSLINLFCSMHLDGIHYVKDFLGNESLITRARNRIASNFLLESDCTHLLFVDADVGFRPKDVAQMVRAELDVVCGAYPMKAIGWEAVHQAVKDGHPWEQLEELGGLYAVNPKVEDALSGRVTGIDREGGAFIEVLDGATGFMLIRREALQKYVDHYRASIEYVSDAPGSRGKTQYNIFHAGLDPTAVANGQKARYLSEDYWFCRQWQAIGGKVHLLLDAKLTHTGTHTFVGDIGRLFTPSDGPQPSAVAVSDIEMVAP